MGDKWGLKIFIYLYFIGFRLHFPLTFLPPDPPMYLLFSFKCMITFSLLLIYIHTYTYIFHTYIHTYGESHVFILKYRYTLHSLCYAACMYVFQSWPFGIWITKWCAISLGRLFLLFLTFLSCLRFLVQGWGLMNFPLFMLACLLVLSVCQHAGGHVSETLQVWLLTFLGVTVSQQTLFL